MKSHLQSAIEFALDLEENEDLYSDGAAMALTCAGHGISVETGQLWMMSLPDGAWWLLDERLSAKQRETLRREYEERRE